MQYAKLITNQPLTKLLGSECKFDHIILNCILKTTHAQNRQPQFKKGYIQLLWLKIIHRYK